MADLHKAGHHLIPTAAGVVCAGNGNLILPHCGIRIRHRCIRYSQKMVIKVR
jgi:hypothetical protein